MAVVCIAAIFFLSRKSAYKNGVANDVGLAYGEVKIGDLATQDSDGDTILDWEENLWGTDPNKKDTNDDGITDDLVVVDLKAKSGMIAPTGDPAEQPLTETDKFSRELFSTVATITQAGPVDDATIEKLSDSLSQKLQNPIVRKVYLASEIKVTASDTAADAQKYNVALGAVYQKNPMQGHVLDILKEFLGSGEVPDVGVLDKLDPIIKQTKGLLVGMATMQVPPSIVSTHVNLMNSLEQTIENLEDMQMFDTDTIVAMSAISVYGDNSEKLQNALVALNTVLSAKLKT